MVDGMDSALPEMLVLVKRELGMSAVARLVGEMGGEEYSIPRRSEGSALEQRVGPEIAAVLCSEWPGIKVSIPNFKGREACDRRRKVLTQPHKSANDLARELRITSRHVRHIRSGSRKGYDPDQLEMFD